MMFVEIDGIDGIDGGAQWGTAGEFILVNLKYLKRIPCADTEYIIILK